MKKLYLLIMVLMLAGCADMRQNIIDLAAEDQLNAEMMRTVSDSFSSTWALNSGAIRTALELEVNPNLIPMTVWIALDRLDAWARMLPEEKASLSQFDLDYGRGAAVMLRVILAVEVVKKVIQMVAPELALMAGI